MTRQTDLPQVVEDLLYAEDHRLLDDPVGRSVKRVLDADVADEFVTGMLTERVRKHRVAQAFAGPFRVPRLTRGELVPGRDTRGTPIRVPLQYLNAHSLCVGGSGGGKTMLALLKALQIALWVAGCWLIDLRKAEFARLRPALQRCGIDLLIVPGRAMRINPLQVPEDVLPQDWASRAADMLVHVLGLPARATKLLHTTLLDLYRDHGIFDGGRHYPTLFDLREAVAASGKANAQAQHAILDSLDPVLLSLGPDVLAYRVGWTSHDLAQRRLVFEFGGLAETDKNLLLNTLVVSELTSRIARGVSNPHMDLWICCDEAARLVAPSNHGSNIADLIGLVRGTGLGLDLSVQSSDVAQPVVSNTATKWLGRCGAASDYDAIGSAMGLTREQKRWAALNLEPGTFIVQLGEGDWRHPFVCRCPLLQLPPDSDSSDGRAPGGIDARCRLPEARQGD